MTILRMLLLCAAWLVPSSAHAYIGPGAGITAFGSLLAIIALVLLAMIGFVWYPAKRLIKNRKAGKEAEARNRTASLRS